MEVQTRDKTYDPIKSEKKKNKEREKRRRKVKKREKRKKKKLIKQWMVKGKGASNL